MLTVSPDIQGKGIGKELLFASEEVAKENNCTSIFMNVISVRKELIAWYIRYGYRDTGLRRPFQTSDPRLGQPKMKLEFAIYEKNL
jgi:ribosomal protein S18 acetylase RimI-like enzyme